MRKMTVLLAAVAALASAPAFAGEGRVEARGGIYFGNGSDEAFLGAAAGYDFDLGDKAFIGVEGSADVPLVDDTEVVWGIGARAGGKVSEKGKLYATGGVQLCCDGADGVYAGAGYQHKFGQSLYGKIEYRHIFGDFDTNLVGVGVGLTF